MSWGYRIERVMEMNIWWVIMGVVTVCYGFGFWQRWQQRHIFRRVKDLRASRQPLTSDEFYNLYFKSEGIPREVVVKTRRIIEEVMHEDFAWARPEDHLVYDMGIDAGDSLDAVKIVMRLEKEFNIRLPDEECEKCSTLGDLIRFVAQKVQQK